MPSNGVIAYVLLVLLRAFPFLDQDTEGFLNAEIFFSKACPFKVPDLSRR